MGRVPAAQIHLPVSSGKARLGAEPCPRRDWLDFSGADESSIWSATRGSAADADPSLARRRRGLRSCPSRAMVKASHAAAARLIGRRAVPSGSSPKAQGARRQVRLRHHPLSLTMPLPDTRALEERAERENPPYSTSQRITAQVSELTQRLRVHQRSLPQTIQSRPHSVKVAVGDSLVQDSLTIFCSADSSQKPSTSSTSRNSLKHQAGPTRSLGLTDETLHLPLKGATSTRPTVSVHSSSSSSSRSGSTCIAFREDHRLSHSVVAGSALSQSAGPGPAARRQGRSSPRIHTSPAGWCGCRKFSADPAPRGGPINVSRSFPRLSKYP